MKIVRKRLGLILSLMLALSACGCGVSDNQGNAADFSGLLIDGISEYEYFESLHYTG